MRLPLALLAVLALATGAAAQSPSKTVEGLVVQAPPTAEAVHDQVHTYVRNVTVKPGTGETLVRWSAPICPLVAGLPRDQGEYILARITEIARTAGAGLGKPDCTPNFYVVVTAEPEALLRAWKKRDGARLFGQQAPAKVGRFIGQDRPVRVWHNWSYAPADGTSPIESQQGPPTFVVKKDSRLVANAVKNGWGVVAVVDATRLQGVSTGQLADYVALTGLAEIKPEPETGAAPTILHLFDGPPSDAPATLSTWDQSFLAALYGSDQEYLRQRSVIATRMIRDVSR